MKGKYPCTVPVDEERLIRNHSFVVPSPAKTGGPSPEWGDHRPGPGMTWEDALGCTHTASSSSSIATAPNTDQESASERDSICIWIEWRQASASRAHERLLALWRGGVGRKLDSDLVLQKDFLKGELKCAGQGHCVQLP